VTSQFRLTISLTLLMVVALLSVASSLQTGRGFNERQTLDEVPRCLLHNRLTEEKAPYRTEYEWRWRWRQYPETDKNGLDKWIRREAPATPGQYLRSRGWKPALCASLGSNAGWLRVQLLQDGSDKSWWLSSIYL